MIVLDTNIVSDLRLGVAILDKGKRRVVLAPPVDGRLREDFRDRILPFDSAADEAYEIIGAERRAAGQPINQFDYHPAAIGRAQGATVATSNVKDFEGCGIVVIDLWSDRS